MYMRKRKRMRRGRRGVGALVIGTPEPSVEAVERTKDTHMHTY